MYHGGVLSTLLSEHLYDDLHAIMFHLFPKKPCFLHVCSTSLEKTVGKGEIAHNEQFLLFPQCFHLFEELSVIFVKFKIVVCKVLQFWTV